MPYDLVVIGGGTGGLVSAGIAASLGARTLLVSSDPLGGECLWTGCVPSKALLACAATAARARDTARYGVDAGEVSVDFARVMEYVHARVADVSHHDDPAKFERMGVELRFAPARFRGPHAIQVEAERIYGKRFVLATGAAVVVPPVPGLAESGYLDHESLWELRERPRRLTVIGGGPIGVEMAQAFQRLGSAVTMVEVEDRILMREEPELAGRVRLALEADGVRILTGRPVERVEGKMAMVAGEQVEADEILLATGKRPDHSSLGLDEAGVATRDGALVLDERLRTSQRHIYAVGDATGDYPFTHAAEYEATLATRNALFPLSQKADYRAMPWTTYCDPALARVGLTEAEARARHSTVHVDRYSLDQLDRSIVDDRTDGLLKVVTGRSGRILGAHLLAEDAGSLIQPLVQAARRGTKLHQLADVVYSYPTAVEVVKRTAQRSVVERAARSPAARLGLRALGYHAPDPSVLD